MVFKSIGTHKVIFPPRCFIFGYITLGQRRELAFRFIMSIESFQKTWLENYMYYYGSKNALKCQFIIKLGPL